MSRKRMAAAAPKRAMLEARSKYLSSDIGSFLASAAGKFRSNKQFPKIHGTAIDLLRVNADTMCVDGHAIMRKGLLVGFHSDSTEFISILVSPELVAAL